MKTTFDPSTYERKWQRFWAENEYFVVESPTERPVYCIMIPPPNVTGDLHIGHALQSTLQDVLVRWKRMQGHEALWLPGTDHAGIAVQLMVERALAEEGLTRREIGREAFLDRVWTWKEKHHGNIRRQLESLGASCDFSRERFTLDPGLSDAVTTAFVRLYREGLIHRDEYMVNWSPALDTAISDLEVERKRVEGELYHIAYPLADGDERVVVATTRPETMLGDTAIAFHPDDERYRSLGESAAILPIVGRRLPFVADGVVDPEFGTGLVKVTPAHDPTDFELGRRHGLETVQVIDRQGRMTEAAGDDFAGLDRFEARERIVERLRASGELVEVEPYVHNVGHSQRGGEPIEPLVSTQWFCDVSQMAERALDSVRRGRLELVPATWVKTWEHWLENIEPWCISRQLWWGHRIPAWYTGDGRTVVAHDEEEARALAGTDDLNRDADVLDTWFSSALWPFSTLGWPEETGDYRTFYPTDVLVTGHDILFFWVARMVMFGLHFTDREPFHTVHLTGLVRDADGVKMSKTRGNVLDPSDLVEEYGADAVRFTLAALDSPGRDIALDRQRMAGYRAFGNKIWNATRFVLTRVEDAEVRVGIDPDLLEAPERWILSRLATTAEEVDRHLGDFRFDEACDRLYHFFWGELCDWYIELSKPVLAGDVDRPRVGDVLLTVLERSLRLLHPVMPHLTEELWQRLPGRERIHAETIALAPYPESIESWRDPATEDRMQAFVDVVTKVRSMVKELGLPERAPLTLHLEVEETTVRRFLRDQGPLVSFLLRLDDIVFGTPPESAARDLVAGVAVGIEAGEFELDAQERQRLESELEELAGHIVDARERLDDEEFLTKAPEEIVDGQRRRLDEMLARRSQIEYGLEAGDGSGG